MAERDMSRYLEDHLIQKHLSDMDKAVLRYQLARAENNYSDISFSLGEMAGTAGLIYTRNAQIDQEVVSWE